MSKYKKTLLYSIGFVTLILSLFLILHFQIPAVQKRIVVFAVWFFAEIYLWITIVHNLKLFKNSQQKSKIRKLLEWLLTFLYWLPAVMVALAAISLAKNSVHNINTTLYLTIMGSSVIQYIIKFVLFCLLIPFDIMSLIIKRFRKEKHLVYEKVIKWKRMMLQSAFSFT